MNNNNPERQCDIRVTRNESLGLISVHGFCFFVGFLIAVCLVAEGYAGPEIEEPSLFSMLESDLKIEADTLDPNILDAKPVVLEGDMLEAENTVSKDENAALVIPEGLDTTAPLAHQLWQAGITVFAEKEDNQCKNELEEVIRRICLIEIDSPVQTAEPAPAVERTPKPESFTTASEVSIAPELGDPAENKAPGGPVSEQTLQLFKEIAQQPDQLRDPFELAEILFDSGCFSEAAVCYRESLHRMDAEQPDPFQDKAWILLQLGNCLQHQNPEAALESYRAVLAECPESPWAPLAKAKSELVSWYLQDQPKTLIETVKPE